MIFFFFPTGRTLSISVTGTHCELMCDHCYAQYLKGMLTEEQALKLIEKNPDYYNSALISGGSTREGKVPVLQHIDFIKRLKKMGLRLNFHTGLLEKSEILKLEPYIDRISFDFMYDDNVIHNVYHLNKTKEDYERTYLMMRRILGGRAQDSPDEYPSTRVVPHFTMGLNCGKITEGDFRTIDELAYLKPRLLVIDVFIPTRNTPFAHCPVPTLSDVSKLLDKAHNRLTQTTLFFGCMRPFGKYREELDIMGYNKGVKGFVKPTKPLQKLVEWHNETVIKKEECCALI